LKRSNHVVNYSVSRAYEVDKKEIERRDEEVIFGGVLMVGFGHVFLESLSRLWYIVKNKEDNRKIVFLKISKISEFHHEFLRLLGIPKERVEIIEKPTQFSKVIIPDETIYALYGYKKEYNIVFDEIRKNVVPKNDKKIYLTRTQLKERYDENEEFLEQFYQKRGYKIIAPETLPLEEQIAYAAGADEIVSTIGTLSHFALFMDYNKKIVTFNRKQSQVLIPQLIVNEARKINAIHVDAMIEILPIEHVGGTVCLYPTEHFKKYITEEGIDFSEEELVVEKEKIIVNYLKKWCENYNRPFRFKIIQSYDTFDFLNNLSKVLLGKPAKKDELYPATKANNTKKYWIREYNELSKNYKELEKEYSKSINSVFWKIKQLIKRIFKKVYNKLKKIYKKFH